MNDTLLSMLCGLIRAHFKRGLNEEEVATCKRIQKALGIERIRFVDTCLPSAIEVWIA